MNGKKFFTIFIATFLSGCAAPPPVKSPAELAAQKEQQQKILSGIQYRSQDDLVLDVIEITKNKVKKNPLETTQEFSARKKEEFRKLEGNGYLISIKVDNSENNRKSLVYFDPDQSRIIVSMPKREKGLVFLGPRRDLLWVHFSYLNIKTLSQKADTYVAQNGFGQKKEITRIRKEGIGVAILNTVGNYQENPQTFIINADRQLASEILKNGRLEMNVFVDSQYSDPDGENILIKSGDNMNPSMTYPFDIKEELHGLPVRLVSLKLYDGNEKKISEWKAQQIFTSSISRN